MIEVTATIIITASSVLLFGYWFRYTCLLILSAKTTRDYAADIAAANQLCFLTVQAQLSSAIPQSLDGLSAALNRDYATLRSMMERAAAGEDMIESRMLQINYQMMRAWYGVSRQFSATSARKALEEMSMVVAHFANSMGERAAAASAA